MPRPRKLDPYVRKPSPHPHGWQVTAIHPGAAEKAGRRRDRYFASEDEANDYYLEKSAEYARLRGQSVSRVIDDYEAALVAKGNNADATAERCRRIRLFFEPVKDRHLARLSATDADELYAKFRSRTYEVGPADARRRKQYSAAHHRHTLIEARSFLRWAVKKNLIQTNPLEGVEGVGARSVGKEQLTGDEARRFYQWCLYKATGIPARAGRPAVPGDPAALALLMALLMALRNGDLVRRVVRDVDLGGTVLRVGVGRSARSKSRKGDRPRRIPAPLQPLVKRLVEGRAPEEPLFKTEDTETGHHTKSWLLIAARRLCAEAGVPRVTPHGLKGTAGTLAADSGALADQIAEHLSHESEGVTRQSYLARGAAENAAAGRTLAVIEGGKRSR